MFKLPVLSCTSFELSPNIVEPELYICIVVLRSVTNSSAVKVPPTVKLPENLPLPVTSNMPTSFWVSNKIDPVTLRLFSTKVKFWLPVNWALAPDTALPNLNCIAPFLPTGLLRGTLTELLTDVTYVVLN